MQFLEFLYLLRKHGLSFAICSIYFFLLKHGLSYAISEISFPSKKTWTIIYNFWNFFLFSKNVDNHMQFFWISFPFTKKWTIICNFWNLFIFSKNVDYHLQFLKFLSLLQKHRLSITISKISFSSPKTWTIICNL